MENQIIRHNNTDAISNGTLSDIERVFQRVLSQFEMQDGESIRNAALVYRHFLNEGFGGGELEVHRGLVADGEQTAEWTDDMAPASGLVHWWVAVNSGNSRVIVDGHSLLNGHEGDPIISHGLPDEYHNPEVNPQDWRQFVNQRYNIQLPPTN